MARSRSDPEMCQHKKDTRETNHGTIHPSRRAAQRREKAVVDRCSRRRPGVPDDRRAGAGGVRLPVQAVARRHPLSAGWPHRYRRPGGGGEGGRDPWPADRGGKPHRRLGHHLHGRHGARQARRLQRMQGHTQHATHSAAPVHQHV
ncbi:hypothetical protein G6F61_014461 [Rhizopus arrhizus]|nr:hypothetical protein G6F61_014461 [Rhizopus arrhizus]